MLCNIISRRNLEMSMSRIFVLNLVLKARSALEEIVARGENWRERQRAQTLLHLDDGLSTADVAQIVGIHAYTVSRTRRDWLSEGLGSLRDSARSGAPKKITPEQLAKIVDAATAEPLTARELLARHLDDGGAKIHIRTLRAALHSSGMVWKRTRHSLKKKE